MKPLKTTAFLLFALFALSISLTAKATVVIGFDINSLSTDPLFSQIANNPTILTDDTISASNAVDLTITLAGTPIPDANSFMNAHFNFNANLNSVQQAGNYIIMSYAGTYTFNTATNTNIISGSFSDFDFVFFAPAGNILFPVGLTENTPGSPNPLIITPGPALTPHLPPNMTLAGKQTLNFTADTYQNTDLPTYLNSIEDQLIPNHDAFFASSFSGTSQLQLIPEPSTLALFALSTLAILRKRKVQ